MDRSPFITDLHYQHRRHDRTCLVVTVTLLCGIALGIVTHMVYVASQLPYSPPVDPTPVQFHDTELPLPSPGPQVVRVVGIVA